MAAPTLAMLGSPNTVFHPSSLSEIWGQQFTKDTLLLQCTNGAGHLCLVGPNSSGKTTLVELILKSSFKVKNLKYLDYLMWISCSSSKEMRGVGVVRDTIKRFSNTKVSSSAIDSSKPTQRWIVLDDAHRLTSQAQFALLKILESCDADCRFILIVEEYNLNLMSSALRSRLSFINMPSEELHAEDHDLIWAQMETKLLKCGIKTKAFHDMAANHCVVHTFFTALTSYSSTHGKPKSVLDNASRLEVVKLEPGPLSQLLQHCELVLANKDSDTSARRGMRRNGATTSSNATTATVVETAEEVEMCRNAFLYLLRNTNRVGDLKRLINCLIGVENYFLHRSDDYIQHVRLTITLLTQILFGIP